MVFNVKKTGGGYQLARAESLSKNIVKDGLNEFEENFQKVTKCPPTIQHVNDLHLYLISYSLFNVGLFLICFY